uniref:hypothetical protein n=1 Tax=Marinobacter salexigens TaxID=1925763 RepID=UPI001961C4E2
FVEGTLIQRWSPSIELIGCDNSDQKRQENKGLPTIISEEPFIYSILIVAEVKRPIIGGVIRTPSQNARDLQGKEGNYLIGFESSNRKGGIIRPWLEWEWLKIGRITPAVAVVFVA